MKKYKPYLTRVDLVKNQVERERIQEQEAAKKRKQRIQEQNRQNHLRYQEQLRSELAARYFHAVQSTGGESFSNKYSVAFDGSNDFVQAKSTTLGLDTAISVSIWVKTTQSTSGFKQLIGEYDWANSSKRNWLLYLSNTDNRIAFLVFSSGSIPINTYVLGPAANIDDGNWHHVMVTWDGTTNTNSFNMFFDGEIVKQGAPISTGIRTSDTPLYIGDGPNGSVEFQGNIDEVAIWDNDQSGNINDIYNGGGSGKPGNLASLNPLLWYRMGDGDTFPTLTDNGSGGNNGTMTNMDSADIEEDTPS